MTDELKKALESAQTEEEKKAVVEKFKDQMKELSLEELDGVAGGYESERFYLINRTEANSYKYIEDMGG